MGVDCGHLFEGVLADAGVLSRAQIHRVRPRDVDSGILADIVHARSLDILAPYRLAWMFQRRPKVGDLLLIGVNSDVPDHTAIWTGTRIIHAWHEGPEGRVVESVLPSGMKILEVGRFFLG